MSHAPGPWKLGEFDDSLGYDCMTGGVRAGPAVLDGSDYGQGKCKDISSESLDHMLSDARLISASPDLLAALYGLSNVIRVEVNCVAYPSITNALAEADYAIAKATKER